MRAPWRQDTGSPLGKDYEGSSVEDVDDYQDDGNSSVYKSTAEEEEKSSISCGAQHIALALCLACTLGSAVGIVAYGPTDLLRYLLRLVPKDPGWDVFAIMAGVISVSIVFILPIWPPMCLASGLIFGLVWGSILNFIAILIAALVSLWLGRVLFREPVRRMIIDGNYSQVRRIMLVLEDSNSSLQFLVLFRFLWIPMGIRNYGPATLDVDWWKLALACIPHSIWISIMFASLGASFKDLADLLRDDKEFKLSALKWQQLLLFAASSSVSIVLCLYAQRKYSEHLAQEQQRFATTSGSIDTEAPAAREA